MPAQARVRRDLSSRPDREKGNPDTHNLLANTGRARMANGGQTAGFSFCSPSLSGLEENDVHIDSRTRWRIEKLRLETRPKKKNRDATYTAEYFVTQKDVVNFRTYGTGATAGPFRRGH